MIHNHVLSKNIQTAKSEKSKFLVETSTFLVGTFTKKTSEAESVNVGFRVNLEKSILLMTERSTKKSGDQHMGWAVGRLIQTLK